jgi:hypothetical protein
MWNSNSVISWLLAPCGRAPGWAAGLITVQARTIQTALGEPGAAGLAVGSDEGSGRARYWSPATTPNDAAGGVGTP